MPILDWDPGTSPEAPGVLYFYEQGQDPSTGFQVTSRGVLQGATSAAYTGATAATDVVTTQVSGDTLPRLTVDADGSLRWGSGGAVPDVSVGRYAVGGLEISGALRFTNGQLLFRSDGSVTLFSSAVDTLHTDNSLDVAKNITTAGTMTSTGSAAASVAAASLVTGDTVDRFRRRADGRMDFGPGGAAARDVGFFRPAAGQLGTDGSFVLTAAGGGLQVKEGANATMGIATLVAGTVTVNTTKVTANSRIFLTAQTSAGTRGSPGVTARVAGTSFTITSTSGTDTSTVAWWIAEPAA